MTSLVLELQREALDPQVSCAQLLRKALVVARKLSLSEFETWVLAEMNGYPSEKVPPYRFLRGEPMGRLGRQTIPIQVSGDLALVFSFLNATNAIGEIERMVTDRSGDKFVLLSFSPTHEADLPALTVPGAKPVLKVARSSLGAIVEGVRNKVVDWATDLEAKGIIGEGLTVSPEEKLHARTTIQNNVTHIHGNVTNSQIAPGSSSPVQNVTSSGIAAPDLAQLLKLMSESLDKLGGTKDEVDELRADIGTIQTQLTSPRPKGEIVTASLNSIQTILEGMAGNVLAAALLHQFVGVAFQ